MGQVKLGTSAKYHGEHSSVTVKSDVIEHDFDPAKLGRGPAAAILELVRERIRSISQPASRATIERRRDAGRSSTKAFNDTGKLVRELALGKRGDSFQTQSPERLAGEQSYLLERLAKLIDLSPRSIMRERSVRKAIEKAQGLLVTVKKSR